MSGAIQSYRDLDAWQLAMSLTERIYQIVAKLPATERFELSSQMRRASVSVPSNIAEGQSCGEDGRYIHHLRTALGSPGELGAQLDLTFASRCCRTASSRTPKSIWAAPPRLFRACCDHD